MAAETTETLIGNCINALTDDDGNPLTIAETGLRTTGIVLALRKVLNRLPPTTTAMQWAEWADRMKRERPPVAPAPPRESGKENTDDEKP